MSDQAESSLQFDRAEFDAPAPIACAVCKAPITREYYSANQHNVCGPCHDRLSAGPPVTPQSVARAVVLGLGAAIGGAALWAVSRPLLHGDWGIIAVAVGYAVGWAVAFGSHRTGGPAFQGIAMLLTYLAIALSYIPDTARALGYAPSALAHLSAGQYVAYGVVLLRLPLMGGVNDILGYLINGFAIYEAWATNRRPRIVFAGPFQLQVPVARPAPEAASGA